MERERVPNFGLPVDPLFWSVLVNYLFGILLLLFLFGLDLYVVIVSWEKSVHTGFVDCPTTFWMELMLKL